MNRYPVDSVVCFVRGIAIFLVDTVIHLTNNQALVDKLVPAKQVERSASNTTSSILYSFWSFSFSCYDRP